MLIFIKLLSLFVVAFDY